ncbi:THADA/TRM732 family protein [bacterium]|nr:THADA/TRM732 family protein [bacterium]
MAFADKELATETVGFAADGFVCAIKAFSSPHWEVRLRFFFTFFLFPRISTRLKSSLPTLL